MFLIFYCVSYFANIERSKAIFYNPSGLGINSGYEIYFSRKINEDSLWEIGISLNNLGIGYEKKNSVNSYLFGIGLPVSKNLFLGYRYKFIEKFNDTNHLASLTFRPTNFLSFSLNYDFDKNFNFGIGLRPISEKINFYFDYYKNSQYILGSEIEIFNGFLLKGEIRKEKNINLNFGLSFSLPNFKISSKYGKKNKEIELFLSKERYPTIFKKSKKLIEIVFSGNYDEDYYEQSLFFKKREPKFYLLIKNLEEILRREDVYGVFIRLKNYYLSPTQYEELREIFLEMKNKGKKIIFYADYYKSLIEYQFVSLADYLILNKGGEVVIPGILLKRYYIKRLLEKLGAEVEDLAIGKYKSARELFTREKMSEEDKEQLNEILDIIYSKVKENIKEARIKERDLDSLINYYGYFNEELAKEFDFIDTVLYPKEIDEFLKKYTKVKKVKMERYLKEKEIERSWLKKKKRIALVIAEGTIVDGKSGYDPTPLIGGKYIGSETMEDIFKRLEKDKSIKAVIFRINSGGGSASASEIIANAVKKCNEKKPVIVSMGNVAASGGYYIASLSKKILANYSTITGSIGIFSIKFVAKNLYEDKLGITFDYLKRGEMADAQTEFRHYTEREREIFMKQLEWWYDKFISRVSEGRNLNKKYVDSIGQGRVWIGYKAKELGLVDEIGSLRKAIEIAKEEAKIKKDEEVEIVLYPKEERRFLFSFPKVNIFLLLKERFLYLMPENIIIE
ncbi:MAG: signal peptide peptidase SppA [candidate division WOR-3 bacterium]|nr:signal peptide peptidase SppA [candidate division WOR-3 bacterium]